MVFYSFVLVQCRDVQQAEQIFKRVTRKTIYMYGAMFKGKLNRLRYFHLNIVLRIFRLH